MDSSDTIIQTIKDIRRDGAILTKKKFEDKYSWFKEKYPKLYLASLSQDFSLDELKLLLNTRDSYLSGQKSKVEVDIKVGEYMGKKYIYPLVGEPTMEEKRIAIDKIIKKSFDQ